MTSATIWTVMLLAGAGTYLLRLSFLAVVRGQDLPATGRRILALIPPAVLAALALPTILPAAGAGAAPGAVDWARPLAAAVAGLVAWRTGRTLGGLLAGMLALWLARWLG